MDNLISYDVFESNKTLLAYKSFINEAMLSTHFDERFEMRAMDTLKVISSESPQNEVLIRVKLLLKKLYDELKTFSTTAAQKIVIVDFGDIMIKKDGKITKPVFQCEDGKYQGSVFVSPVVTNQAATLLLFPREATIEDKKDQIIKHVKGKYQFGEQNFGSIEHVFLDKKVNLIDLNMTREEYEESLKDEVSIVPQNVKIEDLDYKVKADYIKDGPHRQGVFQHKKYGRGIIKSSTQGMNGNWYNVKVEFPSPYGTKEFPRLLALSYFGKVAA